MRNFYYVCSFNLHSPVIKQYLEDTCLLIEPGMLVDFKFRSKLFSTYSETVKGAEFDFSLRLEVLYDPEVEIGIKETVVVNPTYAVNPQAAIQTAQEINVHNESWDDSCAASLFFFDEDLTNEWLLKYEVYFVEDGIEVTKNGELERFLEMEESMDKFPTMLH